MTEKSDLKELAVSEKIRKELIAAGLDTVEKIRAYRVDSPYKNIHGIGDAGDAEITAAIKAIDDDDEEQQGGDEEEQQGGDGGAQQDGDDGVGGVEYGDAPRGDERPTTLGAVVARKVDLRRMGITYKAGDVDDPVAEVLLYGAASFLFLADGLMCHLLAFREVMRNYETNDQGDRVGPAEYSIHLTKAARVGDSARPTSFKVADLRIRDHRIDPLMLSDLVRMRLVKMVDTETIEGE